MSTTQSACGTGYVALQIVAMDGKIVHFRVAYTIDLMKLMKAYCARSGKKEGSIRFLYNGNSLIPGTTAWI